MLGNTEPGKAWALKALHPADALSECTGIPDHTSIPSVLQNFQWSYTLLAPETQWSFEAYFYANPINVGVVKTIDSDSVVTWSPIINPTISVSTVYPNEELTWRQRAVAFATDNQRYRVAYMGVTGHHDASALTNTGMLGVAQYPLMFTKQSTGYTVNVADGLTRPPGPNRFRESVCAQAREEMSRHGAVAPDKKVSHKASTSSSSKTASPLPNALTFGFARPAYSVIDLPKTWEQLQNLPNAFLTEAKYGFYAPYRLSKTCQKWRDARALMPHLDLWNYAPLLPTDHGVAMPVEAYSGLTRGFPFGVLPYASDDVTGQAETGAVWPSYVVENADDGVIHIIARNLTPQASFTFMIRLGIETQVAPGSPLVPFMRCPPPHDQLALDGYFAISRGLKDAYPEEYNGWSEILTPIAEAAADAIGTIVPGVGPAAKMIIPLVRKVFGGMSKKANEPSKKGRRDGETLSAAKKEEVRTALAVRAARKKIGKGKKKKVRSKKKKGRAPPSWQQAERDLARMSRK